MNTNDAKEVVEEDPTEAEEALVGTIAAEVAHVDNTASDSVSEIAATTETVGETEKHEENEPTVYTSHIVDELCPDEVYNNEEAKSESVIVVHAVATFENSPNDALGQDDIISLQKYIS